MAQLPSKANNEYYFSSLYSVSFKSIVMIFLLESLLEMGAMLTHCSVPLIFEPDVQ